MPRPLSWLPRLAEIRRSVKNSLRSHYERKDIERLFQIQPRAAQTLIQGISPSAKVGRSFLLARDALEAFLDQIHEGAHPASLLKLESTPIPRRRLRDLVQIDRTPVTIETVPTNLAISTGEITITFASMEALAASLLALAEILEDADQFAAFETRFVPQLPEVPEANQERAEIQSLFAELQAMEQQRRNKHT